MSSKEQSSAKNFFPLFTLILSICFLCVTIAICLLFRARLNALPEVKYEVVTLTKYVYIEKEDGEDDSVSTGKDDTAEKSYLIKEYSGQIGVFSLPDGELEYVIERYIKTLPEADKKLLEEGFVVIGMSGIYSVIEDYTG